jgi:hypothetical protein
LLIAGYPTPSEHRGLVGYALLGGVSGLIFWIVYERLRPKPEISRSMKSD